jgi:hypothetical protein
LTRVKRRQWSHEEVVACCVASEDGEFTFESASSSEHLYELRRIQIAHIHLKDRWGNFEPCVTQDLLDEMPSVVADALYDWDGLLRAIRGRRSIPPIVVRDHAGASVLLDGWHRLRAQAYLGRSTIQAFVRIPAG